jgi:SRSO17 transposase
MEPRQLQQCAEQLVEFHGRFAPLFRDKRQAHWAGRWLHGLLLDGVRKNAAKLARVVPGGDVQAMQQFISDSPWRGRPIIEGIQRMVAERLAESEGVLVVDDTGFAKKGDKSVGVQRQYSGTLGKVDNCQVGVFLAYVSRRGHCLVDEDLYLPKEWARDRKRRRRAAVPAEVVFRTKPQIALEMVERLKQGPIRADWLTCDDGYGSSGQFRDGLEALGVNFLCEVPESTKCWTEAPPLEQPGPSTGGRPRSKAALRANAPRPVTARRLADGLESWQVIQAREGAKKPIRAAWALLSVHPWRDGLPGAERRLLVERTEDGARRYFLTNAPADVPLERLASVAKREWFVEQCFRDAKQEVGLADFEVRKWSGWHHHMVMCMLAYLFLVLLRAGWEKGGPLS